MPCLLDHSSAVPPQSHFALNGNRLIGKAKLLTKPTLQSVPQTSTEDSVPGTDPSIVGTMTNRLYPEKVNDS
jgi:hypothetical protein